ncbi:hypothetical protein FACS1894139_10010 [Planctomycetales bacterium]|nr:hypothetical protein FACS1894107_01690 [Planctomycetales bacterium]GHS97232.1 hypothetical protein FACS1894108_03260 [Planctomycetales bacterium]GHT05704.1 hypothetical protein FACS1894139_10010 [Planctomycetales bacterium]GHV21101.1 hypothetical protein AGMMS49959_09650 [Planctomycetales bacterium]
MSASHHNLVLGYHGCHLTIFNEVVRNGGRLEPSKNDYDWLGHGIYFWENSFARAEDWAKKRYGDDGKVIGAVLKLNYCLDLTDFAAVEIVRQGYQSLKDAVGDFGDMPKNQGGKNNLDCAVIEQIHLFNKFNKDDERLEYDSVRGLFPEGKPIYDGSGFSDRTHTQICIRNPGCILGCFAPQRQ